MFVRNVLGVQAEEREEKKTQNGLDISLGHIHLN